MDYSKLTVKELKEIILDSGLKIPQKGSGVSGNVVKQDLIDLISRYKLEQNPIGTKFLEKMPPEVVRLSLLKLNIDDVVSFCQSSKEMKTKVCNEGFWRYYAKNRFKIKKLGRFKTWQQLVKALRYDLIAIFAEYKNGKYSKKEAEDLIKKLIKSNRLTLNGYNAIKIIKKFFQDYLYEKFHELDRKMHYYDAFLKTSKQFYSIYYTSMGLQITEDQDLSENIFISIDDLLILDWTSSIMIEVLDEFRRDMERTFLEWTHDDD